MARVVGTDSDLLGNLPESPDRGKREAEAAQLAAALEGLEPKDPAIRALLSSFQEQVRFVGSTKAEVNSDGELDATDEGDHDETAAAETSTGDTESGADLSSEALKTLKTLKTNFDANPEFHNGVTWEDAEAALQKSPESVAKLTKLIARGGEPTVTGEENGEIMFDEVSVDCAGPKNIVYDKAAQDLVAQRGETCNGNAVDIAAEMGAKPIARNRYEALKGKVRNLDYNTHSWVLTDEAIRKSGNALSGYAGAVGREYAYNYYEIGGVRCSLGVKRLSL